MTPSKEAIEAVESFALEIQNSNVFWKRDVLSRAIECAYAIDVQPLEQRIRDLEMAHADAMALVLSHEGHIEMLEAENQRLKDLSTTAWEKYKHLDQLISDPQWLPENFQGQILFDLWACIKAQLERTIPPPA